VSATRECTETCVATQVCQRCKRRKAPRGRSVAMEMQGALCDYDCTGYREDPQPGHLWPGELERANEP
jgi:hypothetical protein